MLTTMAMLFHQHQHPSSRGTGQKRVNGHFRDLYRCSVRHTGVLDITNMSMKNGFVKSIGSFAPQCLAKAL